MLPEHGLRKTLGSTFVKRRSARAHHPGRSKRTSASFRLRWTSLTPVGAACVGYQPTVWWSVQESNLRLPDSESGALPTELTDVDVPWSEPIHGTGSAEPCRVACMPLDRQHQRPSIQKDAGGNRTHVTALSEQRHQPGHDRAEWCVHRVHRGGQEAIEFSSADYQSAAEPSQPPTHVRGGHGSPRKKPDAMVTPGPGGRLLIRSGCHQRSSRAGIA